VVCYRKGAEALRSRIAGLRQRVAELEERLRESANAVARPAAMRTAG
jgi:BMFP domain-containing protein YqiC